MFRTRSIQPDEPISGIPTQYTNHAMPLRPAKHGLRNLTGLFLGVDNDRSVSPSRITPGMGRGRGMPSRRIKTPTEQRRYRKVELLRTREERRGFSGNPLKRRPGLAETTMDDSYLKPYQMPEPLTFWDLTRQTKRHFTAANNAGVTHLEYLIPHNNGDISAVSQQAFTTSMQDVVARDIHQAAQQDGVSGLVECYSKVCTNNQDALNSLLPLRKLAQENPNRIPQDYQPTGFCVKSYRNPHKAEILATFPEPQVRPKTVTGVGHRAYVPSPHVFKRYNSPGSAMDRYTPYSDGSDIAGAAGTVLISRSVARTRQRLPSPRVTDLDLLQRKPDSGNSLKRRGSPLDTTEEDLKDAHERVAISVPQAQDNSTERTQPAETPTQEEEHPTEDVDMMDHVTNPGSKLEKTGSFTDIIIGVENESGEPTPVDIDDTDDQLEDEIASNGSVRRKVSISGRILKSKNSEEQVAHLHQGAESRKKHLEELLDEHAQIVHEVEVAIETEASTENIEDKENSVTVVASEL